MYNKEKRKAKNAVLTSFFVNLHLCTYSICEF